MRRFVSVVIVGVGLLGLAAGGCLVRGVLFENSYMDRAVQAALAGQWDKLASLAQDWSRRAAHDPNPAWWSVVANDREGRFDVGYRAHRYVLHAARRLALMPLPGPALVLVRRRPDSARAWQVASAVFLESGRGSRATDAAHKAASLAPRDPASWIACGDAHRLWSQFALAVTDYTKALRLDPKNATAYCDRGLAYGDEGKKAEAEKDFAQAEKLAPGSAQKVIQAKREDMDDLRTLLREKHERTPVANH